jgi:hypothetical protein
MTLRGLLVAGLLATLLGCVVFGNVPPTMEDQYITTVQDTAVTFTLRAQDEDIDPLNPGAHPLRFVILDGPTHGLIIGDLTEVRYAGPYDAFVEVTYVPATGFVGADYVTITVIDPFDETSSGTTTIQIDVEREWRMGSLSGNWNTSLTFNVQTFGVTAFRTRLTEVYRIGQFVVKGIAGWKLGTGDSSDLILDSLRFQADFPLGDAIKASSTLAFDPNGSPLFDYWRTTTSFSVFDTSFTHTFYLTKPHTSSYQTIVVRGSVGDVRYSNTVTFDMNEEYGFCFSRENLSLSWTWCDLQVRSTMNITDAGFQSVTLSASDYPIPGFVVPNFGLYLDLSLSFTPTSKTLTPTFKLKTAWIDCIQLLTELDTSGATNTSVDGFSVYGIKLKQALGDGITIQMATSFDSAKNSSVTGQSDYFELFLLSGTTTSCCGVPGTWSVATYFASTSAELFDWGMTLFKLDMGFTDLFSASTEIAIRSGTFNEPTLELTFSWTTRW